jgi:hypothetical protein
MNAEAAAAAATEAAIKLQITRAVAAAMAGHVAVPPAGGVPRSSRPCRRQTAECSFNRSRITTSYTKFEHVVMKLQEEVMISVRNLLQELTPATADTYEQLKEALTVSYGRTRWQRGFAIIDHPDLGDRRPSRMMSEMLALLPSGSAPDLLFLYLFLRRLPASMRDHLATADHKTTAAMAARADLPWDSRAGQSVSSIADSVAAVSLRGRSPTPRHSPNRRQDNRRQYRSPTPVTRRKPDSRSRNEDPNLCYYHDKFKHKALKCESPCTWSIN